MRNPEMDIVIDCYNYIFLAMRTAHDERNLARRSFNIEFLKQHSSAVRTIRDLHITFLAYMFLVIFHIASITFGCHFVILSY